MIQVMKLLTGGMQLKSESAQKLKDLVLDAGLPWEDFVLFGAVCPYCGKNDRVRPLEPPDGLTGRLDERELQAYSSLWAELLGGQGEKGSLAVCKFCNNIMSMNSGNTLSGIT